MGAWGKVQGVWVSGYDFSGRGSTSDVKEVNQKLTQQENVIILYMPP